MLKIFKRKNNDTVLSWDSITLSQFEQIEAIVKDGEKAKEQRIKRLLYGEEGGSIDFLNNEAPKIDWKKKYWINGREYRLQADMTKFNLSQFIDYQNGKCLRDWLSVVLIPIKAKGYNDGTYSIGEVKEAIGSMHIVDAMAVSVFLKRQSQCSLLIMKDYLAEQTRKITEMKGLSEEQRNSLQRQYTGFSNSLNLLLSISD